MRSTQHGRARGNGKRVNQICHFGIMGGLAPLTGVPLAHRSYIQKHATTNITIPPGCEAGRRWMMGHNPYRKYLLSKNPVGSGRVDVIKKSNRKCNCGPRPRGDGSQVGTHIFAELTPSAAPPNSQVYRCVSTGPGGALQCGIVDYCDIDVSGGSLTPPAVRPMLGTYVVVALPNTDLGIAYPMYANTAAARGGEGADWYLFRYQRTWYIGNLPASPTMPMPGAVLKSPSSSYATPDDIPDFSIWTILTPLTTLPSGAISANADTANCQMFCNIWMSGNLDTDGIYVWQGGGRPQPSPPNRPWYYNSTHNLWLYFAEGGAASTAAAWYIGNHLDGAPGTSKVFSKQAAALTPDQILPAHTWQSGVDGALMPLVLATQSTRCHGPGN
jgi:hypothetical protein